MITDKLKNITHIPQEYLINKPKAPKSVKIELTSRCNYKCQFCSIRDRDKEIPKKTDDMNWDLFVKITNELKDIGVEEIGLFLIGEPFASFKMLEEAITYLKKDLNFPYVFITSNASMAGLQKTKRVMEAGLDSLKWSCNVGNVEQFEKLMGVSKDVFRVANENIQHAWNNRKEFGFSTKLYASSILYNNEQVELMKPYLEEFVLPFVDEHYWLPLYTMAGNANKREEDLGYVPIAGNSGSIKYPVEPIPCWTLFTEGHIMYNGKVTACCSDSTGKFIMGDINNQTFMEIWQNDEFANLRQSHLVNEIKGSKCENCVLFS